ncbi:MAG: hypothetical protein FIB02_08630 [Desulfuromonas sp.]|nr:hypothetical protein [Desulfuromonas sp.]
MAKDLNVRLEDTKLLQLYFHELWWLAHGIKTKAEQLFSETKVPEAGNVIQVNPDLHSLIASLLSDATNLKKLVSTQNAQLKGESGRQFRLRKARTAALREAIVGIQLTEMLNAKVRNTLEHFDEYLDEANLAVTTAQAPPSPMAAYNMVFSRWEVFNPRVYPVRVYISSEKKYYNMKWSVDIGEIHKEATAIVERLKSHPAFANIEAPGGLMVRLD